MALPPLYIKMEMLRHGVTNVAIGAQCGISHSAVSHIVAGRRRNARVEQAIADAIQMPVAYVFPPFVDRRRRAKERAA